MSIGRVPWPSGHRIAQVIVVASFDGMMKSLARSADRTWTQQFTVEFC
jgi:hypothetical protein